MDDYQAKAVDVCRMKYFRIPHSNDHIYDLFKDTIMFNSLCMNIALKELFAPVIMFHNWLLNRFSRPNNDG